MGDGVEIVPAPDGGELVVERFAGRAEWLSARRAPDVIGASEAAIALGVSPYGTPWSLWESKRAPRDKLRADVLQRGHRWESAVLAEYADESGAAMVQPFGDGIVTLSRRDRQWLRQSPDGFALDREGVLGQVEAKTAMHAHVWSPEPGVVIDRWDDAHAGLVPPHYAIQGYVQLAVTGLAWVDLCALVPRGGWLGVRWVRLQRDDETQAQIVEALATWRERHLVQGVAPELDGSAPCNRYLAERFPAGKQKPERVASEAELALMRRLACMREQAKAAGAECDLVRNALLESAAGHRLTVAGSRAYGQPQVSAGRTVVDIDGLRAEAPELVAKYERKSAASASFNLYRFTEETDQ